MRSDTRKFVIAALLSLALSSPASATSVNRCEGENGRITFTTLGCPDGHAATRQDAHNPAPGTVPPRIDDFSGEPAMQARPLVIVGQRDDGCGNILSADQRRRAIINQQTPPGMTKRDVESLLGKPDRVITRNADVRYIYEEKKGRSRQVVFDQEGCVKGKR